MNKTSFSETENQNQRNAAQSRDVVGGAIAQIGKIKRAGMSIRDEVEAYVDREPLVAVGIAAGAGFVLGSLFGSRLGRLALMAAIGYAAQEAIEGALGQGGIRKFLVEEVSGNARGARLAST